MEVIVKGQPTIEIGIETKTVDSYKTVDSSLSTTSENPVKNKVVTAELGKKATKTELSALETKVTENKTATDNAVSDLSAKVDEEVESLQTQLDSHDVAIEDLQDNKVDKGDYAPSLTAGFSDNLVSKDPVVDSEFNIRQSGGGAISDGVARMEVVKGNSVVWNQLIKNGTFADLSYWSTATNSNVTVTVEDGVATLTFEGTTSNRYNQDIRQSVAIYANHKYFFAVDVYSDNVNICHIILYTPTGSKTVTHNMQLGQWNHASGITTMVAEASGSALFRIGTVDKIGQVTMKFKNVSFYDLTLMFGAGNEPKTVEEFYTRCPQNIDKSAYNAGEVIHCNVDAVKSVGRNVWDEEWELGYLNDNTGEYVSSSNFGVSKNYIPCCPNKDYFYCTTNSTWASFRFYDANKNFLGISTNKGVNKNALFTTPPNAHYMRFSLQNNERPYDICINISGPDFNGQYEPYREDVREIPSAIKAAFPEGMMSAGSANDVAYNDLNKGVGVTEKRMGVIDLGTLNWSYDETFGGFIGYISGTGNHNKVFKNAWKGVCVKYPYYGAYNLVKDKGLGYIYNTNVFIKDSSYTTATSLKTALSGVMLYHELTTPVITEHDEPFNLDYEVTNGGQEQAIAANPTAPFKAEIAYGFNAAAKIKENANEIEQLKATIAELQAAIASMVSTTTEEVE